MLVFRQKNYANRIIISLMVCLLTGCSKKEASLDTSQNIEDHTMADSLTETEENDMKADLEYLSNVSYIKLCDPVDDKFVETIDKKLDHSDLETLMSIAGNVSCSEREGNISAEYYALKFYDVNDNEVATWTIGTRYTIEDSTGQVLSREKELKPWITGLEEKYAISHELLSRTPGANYFYKLDQSASVDVSEIVETPTVDDSGKNVKLTDSEVRSLCCCMGKVTLKEAEQDVLDYCLSISVFSKAGGSLYQFWVKPDGRIFVRTNQAYEVCGDEIIAWVRQIEQTYELR
ncbi:MAG: hypothetical protein Q4D54_02745 [Eubacteriales bacterium]|nr:hypothetical protein [Lachnospiraceae bacterium]MDO5126649.1 hypothetical protein [Eubacteriales bacterium]